MLSAQTFIGDEPFAVLLGDDIVQSEKPGIGQLMDQYDEVGSSVIGVKQVPADETDRYGIIDPATQNGRSYEVTKFVEKPKQGTAPSNLAIMGRYVLAPEIFAYLAKQEAGTGGEIQLTDAIQALNEHEKVYAYEFEGRRFDVGEKLGFVKTTIEFALQNEEIGEDVRLFLEELLKKEPVYA